MSKKKVYLVGAGAGDIELLTLKAVNILKKADVILIDALVNEDIYQFCKNNVIKVNVGKRKGKHLKNQDEINALLIDYANKYDVVVRLKGGTPFVFGRGYEEVTALKKANFEPVIISGVSATTSVPEAFMIPLVDRNFNDSYRTITGHNMAKFNSIITNYHDRENLIIMMAIHNLKDIINSLLQKNYPKDLPLAILSKGTTKEQSKIISTIDDISKKDEEFFVNIKELTPAIIFVGKTVSVSE
jgi:uroporphyrin-III C-methyltransferase